MGRCESVLNKRMGVPLPIENEDSLLTRGVVTTLETPTQPDFNAVFLFIPDLPQRIGRNAALDAAAAVMVAVYKEGNTRSAAVAKTYSKAIAALRLSVQEMTVASPETLCAVLMMMYCQAQFGDMLTFFLSLHGHGLRELFRLTDFVYPTGDPFECAVQGTLRHLLVYQSFTNPNVELTEEEYTMLEESLPPYAGLGLDREHVQTTVRVARLMAEGRRARATGFTITEKLEMEAEELKVSMAAIVARMAARVDELRECSKDENQQRGPIYRKLYGVALGTQAVLLCIRQALTGEEFEDEVRQNCESVLGLVSNARTSGQITTSWTLYTLACAWCAAHDFGLRAEIQRVSLSYQVESIGAEIGLPREKLFWLERRLHLY